MLEKELPESLARYFLRQGIQDIQICDSPESAFARLLDIYDTSCRDIAKAFSRIDTLSAETAVQPSHANYPYLGFVVPSHKLHIDARLAYGVVDSPGIYATTVTQPLLFKEYYLEQMTLLHKHHGEPFYVGISKNPIPLPFAMEASPKGLSLSARKQLNLDFIFPDLNFIHDNIVNGTYEISGDSPYPLSLFSAKRVDFSLHRLHHYTNTSPKHFQNFILLTNYQRYLEGFKSYAKKMLLQDPEYTAFVEPGDVVTPSPHHSLHHEQGKKTAHLPQMPAYHLKRSDRQGITFINIGIGPSNAKNITDHLAVLRPDCWIMLGHCAGLRRSQNLGDYVLAHAYQREDKVMDADLPRWTPIPPIAEVQMALQKAVANVTGESGKNLKTRMRTGTLVTVDNRNWELRTQELLPLFRQSRAMALDMESATIAANGFRFRVPYGTLLCVSDKPIHGEIKLRGMANSFYRQRVRQHLKIGLEAFRILREEGKEQLHSRKLRGFDEPPFR